MAGGALLLAVVGVVCNGQDSQAPGDILQRYPGFLWIVDDLWAVDVVDGRVRALLLTKG